jgi:cytochrome c556
MSGFFPELFRRRQIVMKMRVGVYAGAILMACSTAFVIAQTKVTTPEEFDKAMKPAGAAIRNMGKMVGSGGSVADVKKEIDVLKTALVDTQGFWVLHKKDDAVKLNKESIAKLEAFEKTLTGDKVDPAAAATVKEVGGTCAACHKQYREQDAEGNYKIKAGTIGG